MQKNCRIIPDLPSSKLLLSVEGNIGSGKTTFLKKLEKSQLNKSMFNVLEPVHMWQNIKGENFLDAFYKDTPRWAYAFQTYAFLTRFQYLQEQIEKHAVDIYCMERSIYADRYCFAKTCHDFNYISNIEWNMYKNIFDWLEERYVRPLDGIVYLKVDAETSFKRISKRNRSEEHGISFDYLKTLYNCHEDLLVKKENVSPIMKNTPVLVIDGNREFESDEAYWDTILNQIRSFINTLESNT